MQLILNIEVRPYLLKYLAHSYAVDPFVLNKTTKYGLFLYQLLSKPKLKAVKPESKAKIKAARDLCGLVEHDLLLSDQELLDGSRSADILNYIAGIKNEKPGLADILLEKFDAITAEKKEELDPAIYSAKLPVMVTENYWVKRGGHFPYQAKLDFNKMVMYDFHEEFNKYVRNRIGPKGSINQAIFNFRDQFDISEDELSFKTIQRAFQRSQERASHSLSA